MKNLLVYFNVDAEQYIPAIIMEQTRNKPFGVFDTLPPKDLRYMMLRYFSGPRPFVNKLFDCDLLDVRVALIGEERSQFDIPYSLLMKITANNVHAKIAPVILDEMLWLWKF